jgi:tetratricopeptide (TPR) repeat protein
VAQESAHAIPDVPVSLLTRPIGRVAGIGSAHDPVATKSADAQAFYDQGNAYLHDYIWVDAARSFNEALRLDPALAMAHVGLSFAYTELNKPQLAREALAAAERLAATANDHDRVRIHLRALQMTAESAANSRTALAAYRTALDEALTQFPNDGELWMLRGHAESSDPANRGQGSGASSVRFYEKALSLGATTSEHYLAHAFENSGDEAQALAHAAAFARNAPAVPHALHMHGHELRRAGQIEEAIRTFEAADRINRESLAREAFPPEYDWHYEHNLDLLGSSYWYVGRVGRASEVLKEAFALPSLLLVQMYNKRTWPEFLIARGRYDEAAAAGTQLTTHPVGVVRALGHIVIGRARLAAGQLAVAASESNLALAELRAAPGGQEIVAPTMALLQGEFLLKSGQQARGQEVLRTLVQQISALPGPDNWVQTLFVLDAIARTAREANDWEYARWAASEMIAHDSKYAGGHFALALVAEHDKNLAEARRHAAEAERLWSLADADLPERARLRALGGVSALAR